MMRFTLVVVLIAAVEAATECPTGSSAASYVVTTNGVSDILTPCYFPFEYRGNFFSTCTTQDRHTAWCYTTPDFNTWGECDDKRSTGPDGFTTFRLVPIQLRGGSDCNGCCNCNQIAEFRFKDSQGSQIAPVSVTNPGGNQGGMDYHVPSKLIDQDINTKFLDSNTQPVVFAFSSGVSVISYEWVTGDDATARDMISWRLDGKLFATDAAWTTVHTVSNYGTTTTRKSVVGPFNVSNFTSVCACNAGYTGPDGGPCSPCPSGTYKDSYG
jgi:hypothetical protein